MLWQLTLEVLVQVRRASPRTDVLPLVLSGVALAGIGAVVSGRLARSRLSAGLGALGGATLAGALSLTLFRHGYPLHDPTAGHCALTAPVLLSGDGVTNLLLLAPTALLAVLAVGRPGKVVVGLAAVSLVVELGQALREVGICDSSDALLNTAGAALGALAALCVRAVLQAAVSGSQPCRDSC